MHYKLKLKEDTEAERIVKLKKQQQAAIDGDENRDFDQRSEEHKFDEEYERAYYQRQQ